MARDMQINTDVKQTGSDAHRREGPLSGMMSYLQGANGFLQSKARTVRWVLCGPTTLVVTVLLMMGAAHWLPEGDAKVDNIALPVLAFPLIWVIVFLYGLAEENLVRGVAVMVGLIIGHVGMLLAVM